MNRLETFVLARLLSLADKIGVEAVQRRIKIISTCLKRIVALNTAGGILFWIYAHSSLPFWASVSSSLITNIIGERLIETRIRKKDATKNEVSSRLPMKYLFCFLLPKKVREPLFGDIEEEYQEMKAEYGQRIANLWYCKQLLALLWPTLQMSGRTLVKWGFVGWLEEIIRRTSH